MCGGAPQPEPYIPPAKKEDPEVQEAIRKERELAMKRRGRAATILTDPSGLDSGGGKKTLLGG